MTIACSGNAAAAGIQITPHRAIYQMRLEQSRQSSQIASTEGKMMFTINDACDGWTSEQKLDMKYYYVDGKDAANTIANSSWEAKDGTRYVFTARSTSNSQETATFRGQAELGATGGKAVYSEPKSKTVELKSAARFPTQHTLEILNYAARGEKIPNRIVFDGSDEYGQSEISIFVGKPSPLAAAMDITGKLRGNPLLQEDAWPVRMAFYPLEASEAGTPDYEMTIDLLPNGVARSMLVDYGDFSVRGTLTNLEALPAGGCSR
ncbi:MAG: DUF1849 family protein [Alphaproteobacteria bacterium]